MVRHLPRRPAEGPDAAGATSTWPQGGAEALSFGWSLDRKISVTSEDWRATRTSAPARRRRAGRHERAEDSPERRPRLLQMSTCNEQPKPRQGAAVRRARSMGASSNSVAEDSGFEGAQWSTHIRNPRSMGSPAGRHRWVREHAVDVHHVKGAHVLSNPPPQGTGYFHSPGHERGKNR